MIQGPRQKIQLTFRVVGPDVEPEQVTELMHLEPSSAHARGESVPHHPERVYPCGYWGIESRQSSSASLDTHLKALAQLLKGKRRAISKLQRKGFTVGFYCGVFSSQSEVAVVITREMAELVSALGVHLDCRVYSGTEHKNRTRRRKKAR